MTTPHDSAALRFVLLEHADSAGLHYDLMIEDGSALATWKWDRPLGPAPQSGRKIADHRRAYLTYEGPISGDRGRVRRFDEGGATLLSREPDCWRVRFAGRVLSGTFELRRVEGGDQRWDWSPF